MIIPKKHYRWVWDLPVGRQVSPNIGGYFSVIQKIAKHYQKTANDEFVTAVAWGMLVPHAHFHILPQPRHLGLDWKRNQLIPEKAKQLLQKLALN